MTIKKDSEPVRDSAEPKQRTDTRTRGESQRALPRRSFLGATGTLAVASTALGSLGKLAGSASAQQVPGPDLEPGAGKTADAAGRRLRRNTLAVRLERARVNYERPVLPQVTNGDEQRYPNKIGSDTRGLPHDDRGEVDLAAWEIYVNAIESQDPAAFDRIPLGGTRKLANTLGSVALSLTGAAQSQIRVPPAPALASEERAADAAELYWQGLLRDVPFSEYRNDTRNELVLAASAELTSLRGFTGPRDASDG